MIKNLLQEIIEQHEQTRLMDNSASPRDFIDVYLDEMNKAETN